MRHLLKLILIEDVTQCKFHGYGWVSLKLQGRKRQLCLLNIVVDSLIEVMALVCLHDHGEMIPEPVTLVLSLKKTHIGH